MSSQDQPHPPTSPDKSETETPANETPAGATTTTTTENGDDSSSKRHKPGPSVGFFGSRLHNVAAFLPANFRPLTIAQNLKKTGIGRFEQENGFGLTSVKTIPLINQKNYFTEYLKKDEQVSFIRNWRTERALQQKLKKLKESGAQIDEKKFEDIKNFDNFDLNDIETEMNKEKEKAAAAAAASGGTAGTAADADDDEEEDEENETEEVRQEKAKIGGDVVILQPGSGFIRIGKATDAVPMTVPTVIAVKKSTPKHHDKSKPLPERHENSDGDIYFNDEFDEQRAIVTKDFRARMRYYKRRVLPNSRETAANYNKKQEPERIPDHNDPYKKEWINIKHYPNRTSFVGEDALKFPVDENWILRYPIINGNFNEYSKDYDSPEEILGDLTTIILDSLDKLQIKNLTHLKVMLVIPDLYDKAYVETWCHILFKFIGFGRVGIIQEAVAATFGAGASCACVVDVGAQTTSISCVDEGMVISDSRMLLNYGGDQITETFIKLLLENSFPYKDIDLVSSYDWELAQTLKHNFITFQDADIAVQIYNFYKRKPFETTEKYEFKVFDEVMLAPMGLFFPQLFQLDKPTSIPSLSTSTKPRNSIIKGRLIKPAADQYSSKPNNPHSKSQEQLRTQFLITLNCLLLNNYSNQLLLTKPPLQSQDNLDNIPLEKAIVESITNAGLAPNSDLGKIKKLYDNILVVGGGLAKISGYDLMLTDRINIWRPKFLSSTAIDSIIEYVQQEIKATNDMRQQFIDEAKVKYQEEGQQIEDVELSQEILDSIEAKTQVKLDLEYIDSISDQGTLMPVNVLPPPREFDPEMLTWKGGSVYGRLKVVNEMWITQKDWDLLGSRCLYYKSICNY
ncbi:ARP8 [[Candida] subhashii]|uniref:ARP8 n=1 Tax=[Candida] subhashii TaxID=561895 RepID=A0A8J5UKZ5_9ASCO|nr:ARP8 [[Candida] subhashii]KAG7662387.1 ARP8 [[Candida] subhashii]